MNTIKRALSAAALCASTVMFSQTASAAVYLFDYAGVDASITTSNTLNTNGAGYGLSGYDITGMTGTFTANGTTYNILGILNPNTFASVVAGGSHTFSGYTPHGNETLESNIIVNNDVVLATLVNIDGAGANVTFDNLWQASDPFLDGNGLVFAIRDGGGVAYVNIWGNGPGDYQTFASYNNNVPYAVVPEPASWAMMLFGVFGLGFTLRNSRRKQFGTVEAA